MALPPLRDDLGLIPGPEARDGTPSWTIHDPVRNRYFRIGHAAFEMLARWHLREPARVLAKVRDEAGLALGEDAIDWMVKFLDANHLLRRDGTAGVERLQASVAAGKVGWHTWLLHNYLFFRVPLLRPDRFLAATLAWVRPFYTRAFFHAVLFAWVAGLMLVMRQWDVFLATIPQFFTIDGLLWLGGALAVSKAAHEMGHAYTARRYGCRVPTMGLAFLVMWPVLYTDTSDTWKLVSNRQRMAVGAAGILAEMALGGFALLAWSFLPDGPARSAAFSMVTVTMVATLAMNMSPFMRFDGYYLLSDWLGIENLQARAFALAQWRMRRLLLGVREPAPEHFPRRTEIGLLVYSYGTWIYRMVLFLGIALLVYHMFFKLLGIVLFAVEIGWFVAKPMWGEAKEWWARRTGIDRRRLKWSGLAGAALVLLLVIPWRGSVDMPAVARASAYAVIFPPQPARLDGMAVRRGDIVQAGAVLAQLSSSDTDHLIRQAETRIARQRALLLREVASSEARQSIHVLRQQLVSLQREHSGLVEAKARLVVRSPVGGEVVEVSPIARPGLWVNQQTELAYVADRTRPEVTAFLAEEDLRRLQPGASARFVPEDPALASVPCVVRSVSDVNVAQLDTAMLASTLGGPIAVREGQDRKPIPTKGLYRVELDFVGQGPMLEKAARGLVVADGDRRTMLGRMIDVVAAVLIRESGF